MASAIPPLESLEMKAMGADRPKVSGFTICRNSVRLGFPFRESLKSLATFCDEIVVALDDTGDGTPLALDQLSKELSCSLRIFSSPWDLSQMRGGAELARQTNLALAQTKNEIVFYLQSDEVLDDQNPERLWRALKELQSNPGAASLTFDWVHFYGDHLSVVESRKWYRREIRAFKKSSGLQSYRDAQSFRLKTPNGWQKLPSLKCSVKIFHYGYARPQDLMAQKDNDLKSAWNGGNQQASTGTTVFKPQFGIRPFEGIHPAVMKTYLATFPIDVAPGYKRLALRRLKLKDLRYLVSHWIEKLTGWRIGEFKNHSKLIYLKDLND